MAREEFLSDVASERREPVRAACVSELDSRSGVVDGVIAEDVAEGADDCWAVEGDGRRRLRSVDSGEGFRRDREGDCGGGEAGAGLLAAV